MIPENFWLQPANGFDEKSKGLDIDTIEKKETALGVVFPSLYKELMQSQNGGGIRKCAFIEDGEKIGDFLPINFNSYRVDTFLDYLKLTKSDEDLNEMHNRFDFCYPERLVSFADFHGHGCIFFDYGWLNEEKLNTPSIVIIVDDGDEFLHYQQTKRFDSFEKFVKSLEEIREEPINVLISSGLDFEAFINTIQKKWNTTFDVIDKNWDWSKSFSNSYDGIVPLFMDNETIKEYIKVSNVNEEEMRQWIEQEGRERQIKSTFSPNQFLSGTYQFQDNVEHNIVIDINRPWFPTKYAIENFMEELEKDSELKIKKKTIANNI